MSQDFQSYWIAYARHLNMTPEQADASEKNNIAYFSWIGGKWNEYAKKLGKSRDIMTADERKGFTYFLNNSHRKLSSRL